MSVDGQRCRAGVDHVALAHGGDGGDGPADVDGLRPAGHHLGQGAGVRPDARDDVRVDAIDDPLEGGVVEGGLDVGADVGGGEEGHIWLLLASRPVAL